jgi:hypothetical protein
MILAEGFSECDPEILSGHFTTDFWLGWAVSATANGVTRILRYYWISLLRFT